MLFARTSQGLKSSPFAGSLVSLVAGCAGAALPASTAHAAWVDNTSWTINVSADPIGCPGFSDKRVDGEE